MENRWYKECLDRNLNVYIIENGDDKIICISMLGYLFKIKDVGYMDIFMVLYILVVVFMYIVYKLIDKEKEKIVESWKIVDIDFFNLFEFL